jgi:transcriptional regulator with XRE-family HTH domain
MANLGENIKKVRDTKSQEELASTLGVDRSTLGSWEINRREPDLANLVKLADIAGVSLDWLVGREATSDIVQAQAYYDPAWNEIIDLALSNNIKPTKIKQLIKAALALK